jgi:hypothetical protein
MAAVDDIFAAYALRDQRVAQAAAASQAGAGGPGSRVAPVPLDSLREAVSQALRLSGDRDATRALLVGALDESARAQHRTTLVLQTELARRWEDANAGSFERMVLPRFVPVICDTRRTIASALGGPRFSDWVFLVCRSRALVAFVVASVPAAFALSVYLLSTREADARVYSALIAIIVVANLVNIFMALLLNTEVLAKVVLCKFDTAWSLANVYAVALLGAYVFSDDTDAAIWLVVQLQMSFYFLQDAAPPSVKARRINSIALVFYAAFHCYSVRPRVLGTRSMSR